MLHGCRQSVSWEVRLIPLTDEIPVFNLYLIIYDSDRASFGAKTSRYGSHELGYRRAAKTFTKWRKTNLSSETNSTFNPLFLIILGSNYWGF